MSEISVESLTKEYGDTVALDDVSFEIPDGEFVVVLGVSGSGKSTLLRCLNGLTAPTSGTVSVDGVPITSPRDDIAMIFQSHNIIGQMSAYSNALTGSMSRNGFFDSLFRLQDRDEKLRALEALETVGLLDEAQQKARQMSGGQQQRVGIARALVQQPNVLLADEPVASLDPGSAQQVMNYLRTAAADRGLTAMVSLHQVNLARKFGQRFIGLRDGTKVFDGYRDELTIDAIDDIYGDIDTEGMVVLADDDDAHDDGPSTLEQEEAL
ncbi:phosphonate ABC transporter ATP-binding protein [Natrinema longum]|uniref:Phosphonate ABC transporter ATP-binding protein n=1 Tax=Natrinema longum TaxID=370324 RepID=A0A8A2UDN2_9EURY|nr:phosphonate ABC transporter ATP-binding protein [Natrinema longum]MBZ6495278.1 phosphonate ABC transporter ATP-binding protein [Natrinema longum]QSW86743.1 phosphonate ABC transporter ATP-binding protein [Natrinema longum]